MNTKDIYSLITLFTLSTLVATQSPLNANDIPDCTSEIGCESATSSVPLQNFSYPVKGSGPEVFVIQEGRRRWITDSTSFNDYGLSYSEVRQIFDSELNRYPEGTPISNNGTLLQGSSPDVYMVVDGTRRLVEASFFEQYNLKIENINRVTDSYLLSIPEGQDFK